jgi:N-acetylglucosaminyldiphosphoundecaprenol N-acetyl-beta-D-mannosaminyltransferase
MPADTSLPAPTLIRPERLPVVGLGVSLLPYAQFLADVIEAGQARRAGYVCFANAHMTVEAAHEPEFARQVNTATWVTADGMPLAWALRLLYNVRQARITGLDALPDLLAEAAQQRLPVYFYGAAPDVLRRCADLCRDRYPTLPVVGMHSPPFRPLSAAEEQADVAAIVASGAGLVFVALGCPKQEKFMARVTNRIPAVLLGVGGALPVLVGEQARAPRWMQQSGLEWLYRLVQEPRRLLNRYVTTNTLFVWYVLRQYLTRSERRNFAA